jgi:hypothetical protein
MPVAVTAAVGVFLALIVGSSTRPQAAADALPEPAQWSATTHYVQAHGSEVKLPAGSQSVSHPVRSSSPATAPTNQKPFHSTWMTRYRPTVWAGWSPQSDWLMFPVSFAAAVFQPGGMHWADSATARVNRDLLIRLCVSRC